MNERGHIFFDKCFRDAAIENPGPKFRVRTKKFVFLFLDQTYVVGTQKNRLNETVLLSTQNICSSLWIRKYLKFYAHF